MNEPIRVFIVDDNRMLREGLVAMLATQEDIALIGTAATGHEALEQIKNLRPEVPVIDIGMPGKDGIEVTHDLHLDMPAVKVIILGMPDVTNEIMACIEAGASGYVLKEASYDALIETIRLVHRGESFCSPRVATSLFSRIAELAGAGKRVLRIPFSAVKLTSREVEIVNRIAEGLSNKEIAEQIAIDTPMVKNHIHNILDKLQLHNRLDAVEYAREGKLLKNQ